MDAIIIEGIPAYNGEYPLDMTYFTNRELHLIKQVAGVRAGELEEAFAAGDNDLMVAIAAIAIKRKTKADVNLDALWDAESGKFTFRMEEEQEPAEDSDESLPPPTEPDENETSGDESGSDGLSLNGDSGLRVSDLSRIGAPG